LAPSISLSPVRFTPLVPPPPSPPVFFLSIPAFTPPTPVFFFWDCEYFPLLTARALLIIDVLPFPLLPVYLIANFGPPPPGCGNEGHLRAFSFSSAPRAFLFRELRSLPSFIFVLRRRSLLIGVGANLFVFFEVDSHSPALGSFHFYFIGPSCGSNCPSIPLSFRSPELSISHPSPTLFLPARGRSCVLVLIPCLDRGRIRIPFPRENTSPLLLTFFYVAFLFF